MTDYIRSNPDLSLFAKVLDKSRNSLKSPTPVSTLLGTRGNYTVFAPTNEGMKLYLDSLYGKGQYDIDSISESVANNIVLNCVLDLGEEEPLTVSRLYSGTLDEGT